MDRGGELLAGALRIPRAGPGDDAVRAHEQAWHRGAEVRIRHVFDPALARAYRAREPAIGRTVDEHEPAIVGVVGQTLPGCQLDVSGDRPDGYGGLDGHVVVLRDPSGERDQAVHHAGHGEQHIGDDLAQLRGPFVAALLLGIGDTACKYLVPEFGAFFIYAAMIGLLMWRPAGLFGRA